MDILAAGGLWQLSDIAPIADTHGSFVYRARTPDGRSMIAKLLKPRGMEELVGMDYLVWRRGHGAVNLIARQDNACLLEDAGTRTLESFRANHGEEAATKVFAGVLAELHAPSPFPPPPGLTPLARHFRDLTERAAPAHPDHAEDLGWAAKLARDLLADQRQVMPLHGDLHHENIISQDGKGWRAIDPHGLIGDPAMTRRISSAIRSTGPTSRVIPRAFSLYPGSWPWPSAAVSARSWNMPRHMRPFRPAGR